MVSDHRFDGLQIGTMLEVTFRDSATLSSFVGTKEQILGMQDDALLLKACGRLFQVTLNYLKLISWDFVKSAYSDRFEENTLFSMIPRAAITEVVVYQEVPPSKSLIPSVPKDGRK